MRAPVPRWLRHPWFVLPTSAERVRFHLNRLKEARRG